MDVITYPCWDESSSMLVKWPRSCVMGKSECDAVTIIVIREDWYIEGRGNTMYLNAGPGLLGTSTHNDLITNVLRLPWRPV